MSSPGGVPRTRSRSSGSRPGGRSSIEILRSPQDADSEMRQVRSIIVELNPAHDAMILQILGNFRFADPQMLGQVRFQAAIGVAADPRGRSWHCVRRGQDSQGRPATSGQGGFDVIRGDLIGVGRAKTRLAPAGASSASSRRCSGLKTSRRSMDSN